MTDTMADMTLEERYPVHPEMRGHVWSGEPAAPEQEQQQTDEIVALRGEIAGLRQRLAAQERKHQRTLVDINRNFQVLFGDEQSEEMPLYLKPLVEVIGQIKAEILERVAVLEAKPSVQYRGVFNEALPYQAGDMVSYGGSIWHCFASSCGVKPKDGAADGSWMLAVKSGRDGRDGKPYDKPAGRDE